MLTKKISNILPRLNLLVVFVVLLFILLFTQSVSFSQGYGEYLSSKLSPSDRPVSLRNMPIDWFESRFRRLTDVEVYEISMFPIIPVGEIGNRQVTDHVNPMERININRISEQDINSTDGFLSIRKYEFDSLDDLGIFSHWLFLNLQYCRNIFFDGNIIYDIDYDSRADLNRLTKIIGLSEVERSKLTFTEYPLPLEFVSETFLPLHLVDTPFLDGYTISQSKVQSYNDGDSPISVRYYSFKDMSVPDLLSIVRLNPSLRLEVVGSVLVHIVGDYDPASLVFGWGM